MKSVLVASGETVKTDGSVRGTLGYIVTKGLVKRGSTQITGIFSV